jgi:hypothetical protein
MLFGFYRYATFYKDSLDRSSRINSNLLGRLSIVKDPECKMRVIAMVDYISQFLLKPIHKGLFNKLNNFPCDRTFTQNPRNNWNDNSDMF